MCNRFYTDVVHFEVQKCRYNASEAVMYIKGWQYASCDSEICKKSNRYKNEEALAYVVTYYSPVAASIYMDG